MEQNQTHKNETFDLDLLAKMFQMRPCLCGSCENLRTDLKSFSQPGPSWTALCSYLEKEALCPFLTRIDQSVKGSTCRWNVCFRCLREGDISSKPILEPITQIVDISTFDVHHDDNKEGTCRKHGPFFQPFCIGEPPLLMCLLSEAKMESHELHLFPLTLSLAQNKLVSETRSGFAFIPNLQRWPSLIKYKIKYDLSVYPAKKQQYHTYLLERDTAPTSSFPHLGDLLETLHPERNIWGLFSNIMGTSNNMIAATGESMYASRFKNKTQEENHKPMSALPIDQKKQTRNLLHEQKGPPRYPAKSLHPKRRVSALLNDHIFKEANKTAKLNDDGRSAKHNVGFIVNDQTSTYVKGDPLYVPRSKRLKMFGKENNASKEMQICSEVDNGSDSENGNTDGSEDDSEEASDVYTPFYQRNFVFEKEVRDAERKSKRNVSLFKKARDISQPSTGQDSTLLELNHESIKQEKKKGDRGMKEEAPHENDEKHRLEQNSFRTSYETNESMEYRCPILRAPSSWFPLLETENDHGTMDVSTACELLREDKYPFVRSSMQRNQLGKISFQTLQSTSTKPLHALAVHTDIDSIDVLTGSLGGPAFHLAQASVFLTWNYNYIREEEVFVRNNGFIRFHGAYSECYPGNFFGFNIATNRGFHKHSEHEALLNNPIQVQIASINLSWSHPLKISAIVPSQSLMYLLKGDGALLELFDKLAYGKDRGSTLPPRTKLNQMIWYIMTSSILLFCSIGSKDGSSPGLWSRELCCAFSTVDARKDRAHDSKYGHLSDYNCSITLSSGTMTVGLCLFARHQRALEQHAEVPEHLQCHGLKNVERYRLPGKLFRIVNPTIRPVLEAEIGSDVCLEWFRKFWASDMYSLGGLMRFEDSPERKKGLAFPGNASCNKAFEKKYLSVEDLLPLSETVFRATVHGLKQTAFDVTEFENVANLLRRNFQPACFQDGIIDIAYVFNGAPGSDSSLHLTKRSVEDNPFSKQNVLTPLGCNKNLRELRSYFSGSPGYPAFVGLSTRRGTCGVANSGITYSGIRKVKAYHTKWKGDSFRGRTIYDTPSAKKIEKMFSNHRLLYERVLALPQDETSLESLCSELQEAQKPIHHNLLHRSNAVKAFQNTDGFRLEYTCFFDKIFHFLEEPLDILRIQEERMSMGEDDVLELTKRNQDYFPWWLAIRPSHRYPLSLICGRDLHKFCLSLEAKALNLSTEVFVRGAALISKTNMEHVQFSCQSEFLGPLLRNISSTEVATKLISILSTSLFKLANRQVNNELCSIVSGAPCNPDPYMSTTGLSASWWKSGYPAIILSRLCRFPAFNVGYEIASKYQDQKEVSSLNATLLSCEDDVYLPGVLTYRNACNHKAVKRLKISDEMDEYETNTILGWISRLFEPVFRNFSFESLKTSEIAPILGVFIVRRLIADTGYTLLGSSEDAKVANETWFIEKYEPHDNALLEELKKLASANLMWPDKYRIDGAVCPSGTPMNIETLLENMRIKFKIRKNLTSSQDQSTVPEQRRTMAVSEDGTISDEGFIAVLFKEANSRQKQNQTPQRIWHSVLSVTAVLDIFRHFEKSAYLPSFLSVLSDAILRNMKAAGFGNLCPLFLRKPSGFRKETRSLWGPDLSFVKMRFSVKTERRINLNLDLQFSSNTGNEMCPDVKEEIVKIEADLQRLCLLRESVAMNSLEWTKATEEYQELSKRFWSIPEVDEWLLEVLERRFDNLKEVRNLTKLDLVWSKVLVEKLVQLRKVVRDEGLCCELRNGSIVASQSREDVTKVGRVLQYPWNELYPNCEAVYKKKTRVKQAGCLFTAEFPLLFKVKNKNELSKKDVSYLDECSSYNVEDIYRILRTEFDERVAQKRAHWRLAPTRIVAGLLIEKNNL